MELIFKTEQEKAEALKSLHGFIDQPGWKLIVKALEANIQFHYEQLRDRQDFKNLEEIYSLQNRITDLEGLKNLPTTLALEAQPDTEEDSPDPY